MHLPGSSEGKERATQACKPGFVSLHLDWNKDGDHLSSPPNGLRAAGFPHRRDGVATEVERPTRGRAGRP